MSTSIDHTNPVKRTRNPDDMTHAEWAAYTAWCHDFQFDTPPDTLACWQMYDGEDTHDHCHHWDTTR
jgi:hypothetical protein